MSRKWERMVEKNRSSVNRVRKKQGQAEIVGRPKDSSEVIKGRSWMMPSILIIFSVFYFISFFNVVPHDFAFWFTGFSYFGLGLLIYWLRRPVIKISRDYISVRRFSGEKLLDPKDIQELTLHKDHVVIEMKESKKKFVYTKLQHRFPMELLNAKLRDFAIKHHISIKEEAQ